MNSGACVFFIYNVDEKLGAYEKKRNKLGVKRVNKIG
jgi:hypothetical protein